MPVFSDRIYRISQIFSQFPDETEKGHNPPAAEEVLLDLRGLPVLTFYFNA